MLSLAFVKSALFTPKTCEWIIREGQKIEPRDGVVGFGDKAAKNEKMRKSRIRWITNVKPWRDLWARIDELFYEANSALFGFDLDRFRSIQFTEYEPRGYYGWHEDLDWVHTPPFHRKLSFVLQLSDPKTYEGGDFQIKNGRLDKEALRAQGTVIIFPSFVSHQVTPVTEGTRFSLVTWCEGPKFR